MKTTTCILLLAAAAWGQQVAVPQGGSLGPSSRLSDAASMSADKVDGSHSSSTPGASTVPVTGSNGKLAPGWIPLPTSSNIGGIFMDADCLTGNHVSGIDAASGRLECSADAADWSTLANKPAAFPPDISSQAWQELLAALALKAPLAALDAKLATSALNSTLIVSKFNGGACAGYLKSDGSCDTPSGSEGTPSLDETSVSGSVYSAKPFKVAGTQTDMEVVEGTPVEVAGENHWSVDSATHRPAYSYNGGVASKVAFVGDSIAAENVSGLGDAATKNTGTTAGTLAAGDDSRITGAAPLNSPTFTGTVAGITKAMVGLGNVDNTSDASKPVSTATQTALDLKAALASPTFTGSVAVSGTQTDVKVTEGTPVVVAAENHFSFNGGRAYYSASGGTAREFAYTDDSITASQLPNPGAASLGGVQAKTCSSTDKISAIGTDGVPVCSADEQGTGGSSDWYTAPATTHTPDTENFSGSVDVTIGGCTGTGATAYYTTDGGSTISAYSTSLHLTGTTTLKSRCEKTGFEPGAAKTSIYTLNASNDIGVLIFPGYNTTTATRYFGLAGQAQTGEASAQVGSPIGGQVTAIYCNAAVAPSGGTDVLKLRINGSDAGTCTIADGTHSANADLSGSPVTLAKGDLVDYAVTTLKTTSVFSFWVRVEEVSSGVAALPLFTSSTIGNGSTNYFSLGQRSTGAALALGSPVGGTLTEMYVGSNISTSSSETFSVLDYTASTTPGTCALASGNHTACTGLTGTLTLGNRIHASAANASGSAAMFGIYGRVEGAGAGVTALSLYSYNSIAASSTGYFSVGALSATAETDVAMGSPVGGTVTQISAMTDWGPPSGTPDVLTLNINGVPQDGQSGHGTMQCTITSPASYCSFTGSVTINQGDLLSITANNGSGTNAAKFGVYLRVESAN